MSWSGWYWKLQLASSLVMGGAILSSGDCTLAQIAPDSTLGVENSVVTPVSVSDSPVDVIQGGATRGANLFHSFEQFSVPTGGTAYFNNALNIQNIISRVTGSSISKIDGLIAANGTANLFLLNPNGIIFGPNASLYIGGSFLASTANSLNFADGNQFSAKAPQATPLLTVSVPLGLQFGGNPGSIVNQSQAQSLSGETNSQDGPVGLQVPTDQTLALVGGDVVVSAGNLTAKGGRIELGSVAGAGEVSLNQTGNSWVFGYDEIDAFGDIRLTGGLLIDASDDGGGDVQIQSAKLEMTQGANIFANTLGSGDGGEVLVRTTEAIALSDGSLLTALVLGSGTGGDLRIETGRLSVSDGAQVSASTFGTGAGGTLSVTAADAVEVIGTSADGQFGSRLSARTQGAGDGGDLRITTGRLLVRDGAQVSASTFGTGAGGTLSVTAADAVEVIGRSTDGQFGSKLSAQTEGAGEAGNLTITTGRLLVRDGAQVSASTFGTGDGGTLSVTASDAVEVIGRSADGQFPNGLFAITDGAGNAGDLRITTGRLLVRDGAQVSASTLGTGAAGTLSVTAADAVELIGTSADDRFPSGLSVQTQGAGAAGDLSIETRQLIVRDGANINAEAVLGSTGQGGTLTVTASESVEVIGASDKFFSVLSVDTIGEGAAGDLTIATGKLTIQGGAQVSASTSGMGDGGDLKVRASKVEVVGTTANGEVLSLLTTQTGGFATQTTDSEAAQTADTGAAGDLTIETGSLIVRDGARVSASTFGAGSGGTLTVNALESVELIGTTADGSTGSGLFAQTEGAGAAGVLTIATGQLIVRDGAQAGAGTFGEGQGGTFEVTASESVELIGTTADGQRSSGLFTQTEGAGVAGDLKIETGQLTVGHGASVSVSSEGSGDAGDLEVVARSIQLDNQGELRAETKSGQGGNITLQAQDLLLLRNNGNISTTAGNAGAGGNGGNITIDTPFIVAVPSENSDITANAFSGNGGQIQITTQGIFGTQFRENKTRLSDITASSEFGLQGTVEINTPDVDPSQGLATLPAELVEASGLINQGCATGRRQGESKFIITGRGELPIRPTDAHISYYPTGTVRSIPDSSPSIETPRNSDASSDTSTNPTSSEPAPIVEAQGWMINDKGEVVLTAHAPNVTPDIPWLPPATCNTP